MKPRPLCLLPAVVLLVLSGLLASFPGERVGVIFFCSLTCILPIGFSGGWTKHTGILLWILYLAAGLYDISAGRKYQHDSRIREAEALRKRWEREQAETKDSPTPPAHTQNR